jgi:DNA polymerase elongation subunit (family B)
MTGDIQLQDLVVLKLLGQGLDMYKSLFPHVSAAIQLSKAGKSPMVGEGVEYIHTNAHHTNPLCRVKPTNLIIHGEALIYERKI